MHASSLPLSAAPRTEKALGIVVAEDHDALREMTVEVLRRQGHNAVGIACAEEMDDAVGSMSIDLLIADLHLPGEDGLSLIRRFRAAQPLAGIILVTASTQVEVKVQGYNNGADIYLPKPVAMEELLAAVHSISRRIGSQIKAKAAAEHSAFRFDQTHRWVEGPLGRTELSDSESTMLASLARAPGQRLRLQQLQTLLQLDGATFNKSTFEVRMVRLRKKLMSAGAERSCLRSIRMDGYQLGITLQPA
jgi:DNA-binding response OmpR family regulator